MLKYFFYEDINKINIERKWIMKFKIREPQIGDIKIKRKFAILPIRINDTTVIWLEKYYIKYDIYEIRYLDDSKKDIKNIKWKEINRYV
jgi:hypothetical protein